MANRMDPKNIKGLPKIFGGNYVESITQFPYMAYLHGVIFTPAGGSYVNVQESSCGATILTNKYALTAAHCITKCNCGKDVDDEKCSNCTVRHPKEFKLFAGSVVPNNATSKSKIKQFYVHPDHKSVDISNDCINRFDIAVLELTTPLKFSDKIGPVRLMDPHPLDEENFKMDLSFLHDPELNCTVMGWGITSKDDHTPFRTEKLKVASVPIIDKEECMRHIAKVETTKKMYNICRDTTFCTKSIDNDRGICHGDSGGPVMCGDVQVGITSWTITGCVGPDLPSMFTRVDINVRWISDIIN